MGKEKEDRSDTSTVEVTTKNNIGIFSKVY